MLEALPPLWSWEICSVRNLKQERLKVEEIWIKKNFEIALLSFFVMYVSSFREKATSCQTSWSLSSTSWSRLEEPVSRASSRMLPPGWFLNQGASHGTPGRGAKRTWLLPGHQGSPWDLPDQVASARGGQESSPVRVGKRAPWGRNRHWVHQQ